MELTGIAVIMAGVVLEVLGQLAFKRGVTSILHAVGETRMLLYMGKLAFEPWIQLGIAAHLMALLFWIAALNFVPLSTAYPFASLSYCGVAIGGHCWLGEQLGRRSVAAIALITIGAVFVCWQPG